MAKGEVLMLFLDKKSWAKDSDMHRLFEEQELDEKVKRNINFSHVTEKGKRAV